MSMSKRAYEAIILDPAERAREADRVLLERLYKRRDSYFTSGEDMAPIKAAILAEVIADVLDGEHWQ